MIHVLFFTYLVEEMVSPWFHVEEEQKVGRYHTYYWSFASLLRLA